MPKNKIGPHIKREIPPPPYPVVTRDTQKAVWNMADSLVRSLKDPKGATPGDSRWTVSGLSHSSWVINHPDIMNEWESPLILRIKKLPDGRWAAFGQNRMKNLLNTKILAIKETPPGGYDWDDIDNFAEIAADYFIEQKTNLVALKQAMTPQKPPGATVGAPPQPGGGGEMPGGAPGGMMASRRQAAEGYMTPEDAMRALQITGTGDFAKDQAAIRAIARKSHPDVAKGPLAEQRWKAVSVLNETFIRQGKPLPTDQAEATQPTRSPQQGATVGGQAVKGRVNQVVQEQMAAAIQGVSRLLPAFSNAQVSPRAVQARIDNLIQYVNSSAGAVDANLLRQGVKDEQTTGLYGKLRTAYQYLSNVSKILANSGNQVDQATLNTVTQNLNTFMQVAHEAMDSTSTKQARRASASLTNLRKAQKIARQLVRTYRDENWFLGARVINDRDGIGLGVGVSTEPPRRLRASVQGIPVVMEGPGVRVAKARQERERNFALAVRLAAQVADEMDIEGPPDLRDMDDKELKRHQRLVRKVHNHITSHKRLYGSVRYLARKLKIHPDDLLRVLGQLIVEGKIGYTTKKKKFQPLEPPYTPVPGIESKSASTNSVFGIDRGRSDRRVDQLLSTSVYQLNTSEMDRDIAEGKDIRDIPGNKFMPEQGQPN